jgi:hypothetical protein
MFDGAGGAASMRATAPFGFRYQYLAGGVPGGWSTWNPGGSFATFYIQDSVNNGIIPVFTYYMLRQSSPNSGLDDGNADYNNLQNQSTMANYYADLKLLFQRAGAFPNTLVVVQVEPDLWGFLEQRSSGDNAASVPAQVASSGMPELAGLPNNVAGFARAVIRLRDQNAPNVVLGYHLSVWGTGNDILYSKPDNTTVTNLATRAANFFVSLQAPFDIAFAEYSDRDAAFKQYVYGDNGASWWGAGDFSRNELFIGRFVSVTQKRIVFWQVPLGNTRMLAENNTWEHYQDNKVEWLLDDASRTNINAYVQAGAVAFLFGRGADGPTCACDAANDGVTNPPAINGNTRPSLNADDDGGYFRERSAAYYSAGAVQLPSGGGSPTNTPTRTPTPTATNTPTLAATSTPTSAATNTPTLTPTNTATPIPTSTAAAGACPCTIFASSSAPVSTGSGDTNSVEVGVKFRADAAGSISGVRFYKPAINTGTHVGSLWSNTGTLLASATFSGESASGWQQVTFGSPVAISANTTYVASYHTNGHYAADQNYFTTNGVDRAPLHALATGVDGGNGVYVYSAGPSFPNNTYRASNYWVDVVYTLGTGSSSTSTPTSTPTPTRTPTPVTSSQTLSFDDLANPDRPLNGQYPTGVADWGSNVWYLSSPYGQFTTQSISFNGPSITSATVNLVSPRHVVQLEAFNGGSGSSTVTLACAGQTTRSQVAAANQRLTIATSWAGTCSTVTITSSNGWWTNFDNILLQ